jgi:hypothetical protein
MELVLLADGTTVSKRLKSSTGGTGSACKALA